MDGACFSCGRSPSAYARSIWVAGMEVYRDPSGWAYAHPEGRQVGLCDQCFRSRRFEGLTPAEVEYFEETFNVDPEKECDA